MVDKVIYVGDKTPREKKSILRDIIFRYPNHTYSYLYSCGYLEDSKYIFIRDKLILHTITENFLIYPYDFIVQTIGEL